VVAAERKGSGACGALAEEQRWNSGGPAAGAGAWGRRGGSAVAARNPSSPWTRESSEGMHVSGRIVIFFNLEPNTSSGGNLL
jgi:hypothetical protein